MQGETMNIQELEVPRMLPEAAKMNEGDIITISRDQYGRPIYADGSFGQPWETPSKPLQQFKVKFVGE
jgi:hypothetical protein